LLDLEAIYNVVSKSVIIFILLITLTRLIGKKLLSQMTFFDFVTGITIGTIAGAFVTTEVRGFYVLISPVIFTILVILTGILSLTSVRARKLLEGEPLVLIENGKILEKNLRKIRYNVDDLLMQLRVKGVFDLGEVEFAVLESHGQLSVLKKTQNLPVTPKDLNLSTNYKGLSSEIIRDGKIVKENLKQNSLSIDWLRSELSSRNINEVDEVFLATLGTDGSLYGDLRDDPSDYRQVVEDDDSIIR